MTYQGRIAAGADAFDGTGYFKFALVDGGTTSSSTATASGTVVNGFLVSVNVLNGGAGYAVAPTVTIADPTGAGAKAVAQVVNGGVSKILIQSAGFGYSDSPVITVAPPNVIVDYVTYWSHDGSSVGGAEPSTAVAMAVTKGLFTVVLGDTLIPNMGALPPSVFNRPDVRLRIWFSNGKEPFVQLTPDQRISSVGYALFAANVQDGAISASKIAPNSIDTDKLAASVRTRLDGPPTGGVILSEDPAATTLLSTGYSRMSGARVVREEWQQFLAETDFNFGSGPAQPIKAVWSGSEAIFLTSMNPNGVIGTRYNPASNTWKDITTNNYPIGLEFGTPEALWTGSRLLAFTGGPEGIRGGQYDPASDTWTPLSTSKAPQWDSFGGRWVWTGTELMMFSTGAEGVKAARYNPTTDVWTSIPTNGLPPMDGSPYALWTGAEVLLIGRGTDVPSTVGGRYKPGASTWSAMSTNNAPPLDFGGGGYRSTVIWTGKELLALGLGVGGGSEFSGGRYSPIANVWTPMNTNGAPILSPYPQAVWTGSALLIWNNASASPGTTSARYRPDTDSWAPINRYAPSISSLPSESHVLWTGTEMLVGFASGFTSGIAAGSYNPANNRWSIVQGNGFLLPDSGGLQAPITLWTGTQVLLFAGPMNAPDARGYAFTYTPLPPLYLYQRQ